MERRDIACCWGGSPLFEAAQGRGCGCATLREGVGGGTKGLCELVGGQHQQPGRRRPRPEGCAVAAGRRKRFRARSLTL